MYNPAKICWFFGRLVVGERMLEAGQGIYLMGRDWPQSPQKPREVFEAIPGVFQRNKWEEAATVFVRISKNKGAWCGVTRMRLAEEIRKFANEKFGEEHLAERDAEERIIGLAILEMVDRGLLEIAPEVEYTRWWLFPLNLFPVEIICPSWALLLEVLSHKCAGILSVEGS